MLAAGGNDCRERPLHIAVEEVSRDAHFHAEIVGTNVQRIDTRNGRDLLGIADRLRRPKSGAMPTALAAIAICTAASSVIELCSRSRNSQSKPQVFMAAAISTVRAWRRPTPIATPLFSRRSRAELLRVTGRTVA
jgi:hypothetical protein